jgi:hypothetical protein
MTRPMRRFAGRPSGGLALAGLVLAGAVLSGCGSSTATGIPASSATESTSIAAPPTGTVRVSLVSLNGPLQPAGPIAATTLAALDADLRTALGGTPPTCLATKCWRDAKIGAPSLLVAVRIGDVACLPPVSADGVRTGDTTLRIDIHAVDRCHQTNGSGALARATAGLWSVPLADLPRHTRVTVAVRFTTDAGHSYTPVGDTTAILP